MINILLVDDHPSVREGTKAMIEADNQYQVTLAASGEEAIERIESSSYDLYIFDLFIDTINGIDLTKRVIAKDAEANVLIMTGFDIESHFNILMEAGAGGFISKTASKDQLLTAIKCALRKEAILPISFLQQLRQIEFKGVINDGDAKSGISLNEKEQQVLYEASLGKSNKEIAQSLMISQRMVEYHLTKIFGTLNVSSRGEAVAKARELRLLPREVFTNNS
ncbi:response regulator transcription factor [Schinkia azotoformans]|uniref:LuxR family transcriptional regulator n=1 Tax=Schinkia azotoformans LMG 9581 TaxID=1131731 RepID=K6DKZ6_SCHAZ|nr:response regulator transcription factor [Schinkia azotoformans]EKN68838.1 LuxR family transcriptional regulator [Schinkia azotoformans LMG 9581]MEC1638312.1 response regulator transcription factor [Schinkia azotoformans]MEC1946254.1 response regulator transcription factor [Schinkia azotoformans]